MSGMGREPGKGGMVGGGMPGGMPGGGTERLGGMKGGGRWVGGRPDGAVLS